MAIKTPARHLGRLCLPGTQRSGFCTGQDHARGSPMEKYAGDAAYLAILGGI